MRIVCPGIILRWLHLIPVIGMFAGCTTVNRTSSIPEKFACRLPDSCRQVVLVVSNGETSSHGKLWLLERNDPQDPWTSTLGPFAVDLGRNGMAWSGGGDAPTAPPGSRMKCEGDGCSPAGVFHIPYAFGYATTAPGFHLHYVPLASTSVGVDDSRSRYYNQVVDSRFVEPDWKSGETMLRADGIYRWGAFVACNADNTPGRGSCIFMHVWHTPRHATIGCTAMSAENLLRVLKRLDPAQKPRLVQIYRGQSPDL